MSIQGSLTSVPIPDLFTLLLQLRKTGVLTVVGEKEERSFLFHGGNLVHATTQDDSRRLGSYLVRHGALSEASLEEIFAESQGKEGYFGQRVVELKHVTQEQLNAAVSAQIVEILHEAMSWKSGAFYFDDTELPFEAPGQILVSTTSVILEIARKTDETVRFKDLFPDGQVVFEVRNGTDPSSLSDAHREVIRLVDGTKTVDQIFVECHLAPAETAAALEEMVLKGVVVKRNGQSRRGLRNPCTDLKCLPIAPDTVLKLFSVFNSEDGEILRLRVQDILSSEPLLMAKLLKMLSLNNVEVGSGGMNAARLIDMLGIFQVRCSLIPEATRAFFFPHNNSYWSELWSHSRQCAALCRKMAQRVGYAYPEEAFLAGLLHNLGAFLLLHHAPRRYMQAVAQSRSEKTDMESVEESIFGLSHTKLGGTCADKWGLPQNLVRVIKNHHRISAIAMSPLLQLVGAANGLLQECGVSVGLQTTGREHVESCLSSLNLDHKKARGLVPTVRQELGLDLCGEEAAGDGAKKKSGRRSGSSLTHEVA